MLFLFSFSFSFCPRIVENLRTYRLKKDFVRKMLKSWFNVKMIKDNCICKSPVFKVQRNDRNKMFIYFFKNQLNK